jgi:leader peptidase (prepilin peptidase) / N-methyltransferase
MFPTWTWIVGLFIGAAIGSFLNALIYRMPRGLSISEPKNSFCPKCKARLTLLDLFPLLSWMFLGGKCRHCRAPIPSRYFFVELFTGAMFAAFWWQHLIVGEDPWRCACLSFFSAALILAFFIDIKHYIIPDQVNAAMLFIGVAYNIGLYVFNDPAKTTWGIPSSVAGALLGAFVIWFIALLGRLLFGKDAMGHGDIKMARGMGAMLFPAMTGAALGVSVVFGALMGFVAIAARMKAGQSEGSDELDQSEEEEEWEPESIGSLFKCGVGYFLCFDVIGLFVPKFYENYFGENPYSVEEVVEEDEAVPLTMIPFGPSLALGALAAALFEPQLLQLWRMYLEKMNLA